jgi:hypothetical protein
LDYFNARYYSSAQGRFTSVDPLMRSASISDPETFNRYTYVSNNPLNLTDPTGEQQQCPEGQKCDQNGNIIVGVVGSVTVTSGTPVTTAIPDSTPIYESSWLSRLGSWLWRGAKATGRGIGEGALRVGGAVAIIVLNPVETGRPCGPNSSDEICKPATMSDEPDADTSANPDPEDNKPDSSENTPESTEHDKKRKSEGRKGNDPRRDIGDANRVRREGKRYIDENGNIVYVGKKGHTVIYDSSEQRIITRNTYTKKQVQSRLNSGKWRRE